MEKEEGDGVGGGEEGKVRQGLGRIWGVQGKPREGVDKDGAEGEGGAEGHGVWSVPG